jgi:hypothetical protein
MTESIENEEVFDIEVHKKEKMPKYKVEEFTQSQAHGLFRDSEIREKVFGLNACKNDTKKYDICCLENKFNSTENISIKTSSNNNIDCGDILRFYNGDFTNKYTIILLRYVQIKLPTNSKKIKEIIEIDYNIELRDYLFGTITEEILEDYVKAIKNIPRGNETNKTYLNEKIILQTKHNMNINISPKVDSTSQRRVQCSIPKLDKILKLFPQNVISRTSEPIIRNVKILSEINSAPRVRNSKSSCVASK